MITLECTTADDRRDAQHYAIQIHRAGALAPQNFCASVTALAEISKKRWSGKPSVVTGVVSMPEMEV